MQLSEIMPRGQWVEFEKEFNERTGLNCCLIDEMGVRITAYHRWANPLCSAIRGDKRGRAVICERNRCLLEDRDDPEEVMVVDQCRAGLIVACIPVRIGGTLVGLVGGCGMLPGDGRVDALAVATPTGLSLQKIQSLSNDIGVLHPQEVLALGSYLLGRIGQVMNHQP